MLRILFGRDIVYGEISKAAKKGTDNQLFIVPQHVSHEAERKLCFAGGDAISLYCEVLTFKRLAFRVFGEYGGLSDKVLDSGGRLLYMHMAVRSVSSQLKEFASQIRKPEFLQDLLRLVDEFKTYGVTADDLARTVTDSPGSFGNKLADIALIYGAYDALLKQGETDPGDILDILYEKLERYDYAAGKTIYIYGFSEFTPQEAKILEPLLCKANSLTVCFDLDLPQALEEMEENLQDGAFLGYRKSIENLKRLAGRYGKDFAMQDLAGTDDGVGEEGSSLAFLRRNLLKTNITTYTGNCKEISLHTADNKWDECEQAAALILRLCREDGYRFRDIILAAPDYSAYAGIVEAVFESWNIPLFSDRTESIMQKPVMTAVEAAMDMLTGGFENRDVLRYLKTGLTGLTYDQCCRLENYVLAWNIKGRQWTSKSGWTMNPKGFSEDPDDVSEELLRELNGLRTAVIQPFLRFLERVPAGRELPAEELITAFFDFLTGIGIERAIAERREFHRRRGDLKLSEEYAQLWGMICDALDTCFSTLRGIRIGFDEFFGMFRLLLGSMEVGTIPISLDCVAAGDAGRMRHRTAKCVILIGCVNGAFPPPVNRNSLLTDENRETLLDLGIRIEPPSSRLAYRELEAAYSILALPEERLIISWPQSDKGAKKTLSYLADRIRRMFSLPVMPPEGDERLTYAEKPCLELALRAVGETESGILSRAALEYFRTRGEYNEIAGAAAAAARSDRGRLSAESVKRLYGSGIRLTASRADKLKSCKYAYFMQYGLKAKPRQKAGFDAMESGSFLHYVLEGTIKEVIDRGGFDSVTNEDIGDIAGDFAEKYATEVLGGMEDKSARVRFLFGRLKSTALRVVENVADELRASEFKPLDFELEFGGRAGAAAVTVGDGDEAVELTGIVDRVDGWVKDGKLYIRVVDYKSGTKKFDLSDIWHGLSLQMLIYLFALEKRGPELYGREAIGAGVMYVPVREAVYSGPRGMDEERIREKVYEALRRSGIVMGDPDVIEAMEKGQRKRFIPVSVARSGDGYSDGSSIASLEQLGKLKRHVDMLVRQMGRALREGRVEADPFFRDIRTSACTYCDYAEACHFDITNGVDRMRYLYRLKADEFWERLEADGHVVKAD